MKEALRSLLVTRDLQMAFQPIWDLDNEKVLGYEALARPPAVYGFLGPDEMFKQAHGSLVVHELDALCFESIVRAVPLLPQDGLLFVNISPATLEHAEFDPARLVMGIRRRGFTPERVVLEVTEREISNLDLVVKRASAFRDYGVKLALDDTGAGNAGLWMLSLLPVEFIKIDQAIVNRALHDRSSRAVLAGITAIARENGSTVIAEGIETNEALQFIFTHRSQRQSPLSGIGAVQGFLIAEPQLAGTPHDQADMRQRVAVALELTA